MQYVEEVACNVLYLLLQLVSDEPDIEPDTVKKIFTENVHRMPPQHLTENGFRCSVCASEL